MKLSTIVILTVIVGGLSLWVGTSNPLFLILTVPVATIGFLVMIAEASMAAIENLNPGDDY